MGGICASGGCGAGKGCGMVMCCPCQTLGAHKKSLSKIGYIFFSFFWVLVSFILLFTAKEIFEWADDYINCPKGGTSCFGTSAIFRMSFVLMLFHILIFVLVLPRMDGSAYFHDGGWITKFFLILSAFIICFWVPNDFFKGYGYFSLVVSFFFLLFQGIVILGLGYTFNDAMIEQSEKNNSYLIALIAFAGILASISLLFIILEFVWFHEGWSNNILILIPVIFAVICIVLVVLKTRENASLFTTSAMLLYLVYLTWTALASRPSDKCNPFYREEHGTILQILFGLIFTFITMIILAFSKKDGDKEHIENKLKNMVAEEANSDDEMERTNTKGETEKANVFPVSPSTIIFQGFMVFVSIYYAMLITNWGRPTVDDDNYDYFIDEWAGFWVKIVDQWVMCGLFIFSLIAPKIFPGREW